MKKLKGIVEFIEKILDKFLIYIYGLIVAGLNISLIFDNVVWGDEAYSEMAIRSCDLYGVFERVYYWDSHPPLYYYYLKLFADLLGYETWVYHLASILPFIIGIILACSIFKKEIGTLPSMFFITITGLSQSCAEYNQEIRMYSLVFFFVLLTGIFAYIIIKKSHQNMDGASTKASYWVLMTLFGLLSAYTHYYGLILTGIMIFVTSVFYALENKKKSWLYGFVSILVYIVLYIPWLFVLYFQTKAELGNSWMTEPEHLSVILRFICGGTRLEWIVLPFIIIVPLVMLLFELGIIKKRDNSEENTPKDEAKDSGKRTFSLELKMVLLCYLSMLLTLGFSYAVSYAFHPILATRYAYVLIPLVLFILMFSVKWLFIRVQEPNFEKAWFPLHFFCLLLLLISLVMGLLDFKYFRSVCKTQDYQTSLVLDIVGTPSESAVLCSNGVKHLAWSVLSYYYEDNEITMKNPDELSEDVGEIWCFMGYEFDDDLIKRMQEKGYTKESYPNMWLGKYNVWVYHFYNW